MQRRLWMVVLILGLAVSARPAASRVKRCWLQWSASTIWKACRMDVAGGGAGEPCGWIEIPQAGIDQMVLEGADIKSLARFPCYEAVGRSTLIMGHRDTHFMGLGKIKEGDLVHLEQRGGEMRMFECEEIHVVERDEVRALIEKFSDKGRLLLLTCYPFRYIGAAPKRFLVVAQAVSSTEHKPWSSVGVRRRMVEHALACVRMDPGTVCHH